MPAQKCCRSTPRCTGCPVLLAARRARRSSDAASVVEDILYGTPPRALPEPVLAALATLEAARHRPSRSAVLSPAS